MKKIFLLLSLISLFSFTSCEKKISEEKISQNWWKNIFSSENFLASTFDENWDLVSDEDTEETQEQEVNSDEEWDTEEDIFSEVAYSKFKNKWFRDCIEQDFKCVWADEDCIYWSWQNIWWCSFWCWEWNDQVVLRKDLSWDSIWCNENSAVWISAKKSAEEKCSTNYYKLAQTSDDIDYKWPCIDENPSIVCPEWQIKACICWSWNVWEFLDWKVKVSCSDTFCDQEWSSEVKETEVDWKNAYYLAVCKETEGKMHFLPDDSKKWELAFKEISWIECSWDKIWSIKNFYKDASSLWKCEFIEFECTEVLSSFDSWLWVSSATSENRDFLNTWCVLKDENVIVTSFEVCNKDWDICYSESGSVITIDSSSSTELSFKIIWKNNEKEIVNDWYYNIWIWNTFYSNIKPNSSSFIWSSLLWNNKMLWKSYYVEIIPAFPYTETWANWNEDYVYNTSSWITIIFKDSKL